MCPQLAESTNVAEVHHKHNGFQMALRSESENPEAQQYLKAVKFRKVHWSGLVPDDGGKETFWHITDSTCCE